MSTTFTAAPDVTTTGVGKPVSRIDGVAKVTGGASFSADALPAHLAWGVFALSPVAKGELSKIDLTEANKVPGVIKIYTHTNLPKIKPGKPFALGGSMAQSFMPLTTAKVAYEGQQIAYVVADMLEAAEEAARLVKPVFAKTEPAAVSLQSELSETKLLSKVNPKHEEIKIGDAAVAFENADHQLDVTYTTPAQHHNPIEPYASTAEWEGDRLTLYEPSQFLVGLKYGLAEVLEMDPTNLHVRSPFVGGAFGSKATITPHTVVNAVVARDLNRPVKAVISRELTFTAASYRAEANLGIKASCDKKGKLTSLSVDDNQMTSRFDPVTMNSAEVICDIYACPNIAGKVKITHADTTTPGFMRAPAEVPGMFALESMMDELAEKCGLDPIEFRKRNEPEKDPLKGLPFSSRNLVKCYEEAAASFGWEDRPAAPKSVEKDGSWVGYGCATALYPVYLGAAVVSVQLSYDGQVQIKTSAHDVGTGQWSTVAQICSEFLGLPMNKISVSIGDSELPPGPLSGGSASTPSLSRAIGKACDRLKDQLFKIATNGDKAKLQGEDASKLTLRANKVLSPAGKSATVEELLTQEGTTSLSATGEASPPGAGIEGLKNHLRGKAAFAGFHFDDHCCAAWGCNLVEVHVDKLTGEIRVPRITGAFAAGTIINKKQGHSQLMGGMIWGISSALHEQTAPDHHQGKWVNKDLAEYLIPVNADVQKLDVIVVPEEDKIVNPLGAKGIGELGIVGVNAAIANAVYNATGERLRDLPLRLDRLV